MAVAVATPLPGDADAGLLDTPTPAPAPIPKLPGFDPRLVEMFVNIIREDVDVKKIQVNPVTVITAVKAAMELVEARAVLDGDEKKRLVLHITRYIVDQAHFDDPRRKQLCLELFDTGVVSATIDLAVAATKGQLDINAAAAGALANSKKGCACVIA